MIPTRKKLIGKNKVEEYTVVNYLIVYINGKHVIETYEQAVERLEREE